MVTNSESPKALTEDGTQFVGLALDDVNQFEETDERIAPVVYANLNRD
ncbi:flavodoxin FldB [Providencia stuartii]|nr:flavodoxin FldB [Providencia stuartii]